MCQDKYHQGMGSKDPHPASSVVAALHREAQQAVLAFVPLCFAHSDLSQRSSQTPNPKSQTPNPKQQCITMIYIPSLAFKATTNVLTSQISSSL